MRQLLLISLLFIGSTILETTFIQKAEAYTDTLKLHFQNIQSKLMTSEESFLSRYKRQGCKFSPLSRAHTQMVQNALHKLRQRLLKKAIHDAIRKKKFTFTRHRGKTVLYRMRQRYIHLKVLQYQSLGRCTLNKRFRAYIFSSLLLFNISYLKQIAASKETALIINTIVHEWLHVLGFRHGNNANQGSYAKQNSIPIYIACLIEKFPASVYKSGVCGKSYLQESPIKKESLERKGGVR